ncbi:hypothetical protein F2Q68_00006824 [Brassica cretica]|uniref:Uncharacterized protein n=1 Tax=Brassica cretica TaxID=69181 RepID=A0A8S9JDP0_BRACR|nr:hypothetical protein F2Q68_00006824 [Brassica cretica]
MLLYYHYSNGLEREEGTPRVRRRRRPAGSARCGRGLGLGHGLGLGLGRGLGSWVLGLGSWVLGLGGGSVALTERILRVKERDSSRLHGFIFVTALNRLYIFLNIVYIISFLLIRFSGFYKHKCWGAVKGLDDLLAEMRRVGCCWAETVSYAGKLVLFIHRQEIIGRLVVRRFRWKDAEEIRFGVKLISGVIML